MSAVYLLKQHRPSLSWLWSVLFGIVVAGAIFLEFGFPLIGCTVKGNISPKNGERIYHVPGQAFYSDTRVDWLKGERWFCSEASASAAGWRKAMR
jgi:hypothetical protein